MPCYGSGSFDIVDPNRRNAAVFIALKSQDQRIVSRNTLDQVLIAFVSVIARYVFKSGFLWADELSQAFLVAMGMFGCARAVRTNGHTEFTMLTNKVKYRKGRIAIRAVIAVVTVIFLIILFANSLNYTMAGTAKSSVLAVPRMYYYMSIPIGFALCIFEYFRNVKRRVINDPEPDSDQQAED